MQVKPDQLYALTGLKTGTKTALILCAEMPAEDLAKLRDLFVEMQDAAASALQRIDSRIDRPRSRKATHEEFLAMSKTLGLAI